MQICPPSHLNTVGSITHIQMHHSNAAPLMHPQVAALLLSDKNDEISDYLTRRVTLDVATKRYSE